MPGARQGASDLPKLTGLIECCTQLVLFPGFPPVVAPLGRQDWQHRLLTSAAMWPPCHKVSYERIWKVQGMMAHPPPKSLGLPNALL